MRGEIRTGRFRGSGLLVDSGRPRRYERREKNSFHLFFFSPTLVFFFLSFSFAFFLLSRYYTLQQWIEESKWRRICDLKEKIRNSLGSNFFPTTLKSLLGLCLSSWFFFLARPTRAWTLFFIQTGNSKSKWDRKGATEIWWVRRDEAGSACEGYTRRLGAFWAESL